MKNSEIWEIYEYDTKQASVSVRWLAGMLLAGVLYKIENYSDLQSITVLGFLFSVFIIDILQYVISAHIIKEWTEKEEKKYWEKYRSIEECGDGKQIDYKKPKNLDRIVYWLWRAKIILFLSAIILFLCVLYTQSTPVYIGQ